MPPSLIVRLGHITGCCARTALCNSESTCLSALVALYVCRYGPDRPLFLGALTGESMLRAAELQILLARAKTQHPPSTALRSPFICMQASPPRT